jgi:hypothetical protein
MLPEILTRAGSLTAAHANDRESIDHGRIYLAPPNHHLVIEHGYMHLSSGPKEQHHRPAINVMFRSAALAYGERVIGVLLSGELDGGTAGLWEIERRGGATIVQNPEEATFPTMPLSALRELEVHHIVSAAAIGPLLTLLSAGNGQRAATGAFARQSTIEELGRLTDITCPECRGTSGKCGAVMLKITAAEQVTRTRQKVCSKATLPLRRKRSTPLSLLLKKGHRWQIVWPTNSMSISPSVCARKPGSEKDRPRLFVS